MYTLLLALPDGRLRNGPLVFARSFADEEGHVFGVNQRKGTVKTLMKTVDALKALSVAHVARHKLVTRRVFRHEGERAHDHQVATRGNERSGIAEKLAWVGQTADEVGCEYQIKLTESRQVQLTRVGNGKRCLGSILRNEKDTSI